VFGVVFWSVSPGEALASSIAMSLRTRPLTLRGLSLLLIGVGLFAVVDGFTLAVVEEDRTNYGRVSAGIVVERLSSTGEDGTRAVGGAGIRRRAAVRIAGFDPYSTLVRFLASGSSRAYVIDYRYPCSAAQGSCFGRDFVSHSLWSRLHVGSPINVRRSPGEKTTPRLDENPLWGPAVTRAALGCVLLIVAAVSSGRIRLRPRVKYAKAPAVVTAVQEVSYGDEKRWRVTFCYFDANAEAQESVDEANDPTWRVGEACIAVYRPQAPDVATLQPLSTHGGAAGLQARTIANA
jgi:hypothetical protein